MWLGLCFIKPCYGTGSSTGTLSKLVCAELGNQLLIEANIIDFSGDRNVIHKIVFGGLSHIRTIWPR